MKFKRKLKKLGIIPLQEITVLEKNRLIQLVASCLVNAFPRLNFDYNRMMMKLYCCTMYRAKIEKGYSKVNYFYKNQSIYFDETVNLQDIDVAILYECIHYIQDNRNVEGELKQIGLCQFSEYKIHGFTLNELAVQYIANKVLNTNMLYQDYLNTLLKQIIFIVGEDTFITSTIRGNAQLKEKFMYQLAEEEFYYKLENGFDIIAKKQDKLKRLLQKQSSTQSCIKLKEEIYQIFENLQQEMFTKYFQVMIKYIDNISEIEECKIKIEEYKENLIDAKKEKYEQIEEKLLEKLNKKVIEIYKKKASNSLSIIHNNPIANLFRVIRKAFFKTDV